MSTGPNRDLVVVDEIHHQNSKLQETTHFVIMAVLHLVTKEMNVVMQVTCLQKDANKNSLNSSRTIWHLLVQLQL